MTVERARGDENDKAGYSRQTLIRNRRLRYIQLNPALLKRLESGQSITADHDTPYILLPIFTVPRLLLMSVVVRE